MSFRLVFAAAAAFGALAVPPLAGLAADSASDASAASARAAELPDLFAQERARRNIYDVRFPDAQTARRAAISFEGGVLAADIAHARLTIELDDADVARLRRDGYAVERAEAFLARRDAMLRVLEAAGPGATLLGQHAVSGVDSISHQTIPGFPCYQTVDETFAAAAKMVAKHPTLATWLDVGDSWEKANGLGGHDMRVLKLTNQNIGGTKPILLITSAIHAREYTTAPLALALAKQLIDGYGKDADATWILDNHEVHLLLQTNPDGRVKAESGLLWRKNTNQAYCGPNSNDRGADLNRNFEFSWNSTHGQGSSGNPCDETYRGTAGASEPEVQAVTAYMRSLWPDRRGPGRNDPAPDDTSGLHIDLHSYGDLVLWPWGDTTQASPNATEFQTLGRKFAWFNDYYPEQSIGLYPTDGTSDGPPYGELGVPSYTIELGSDFFQSCSVYTSQIKPANLAVLMYAAKVARTPYETPAGPDVSDLALKPNAAKNAVKAGKKVQLTADATVTHFSSVNGVEPTQPIAAAEYYVDTPPWLAGATAIPLSAADGAFDEKTEKLVGKIGTDGWSKGAHLVYVRSQDAAGHWGAFSAVFLKIGK
jgi:hypothetical protein